MKEKLYLPSSQPFPSSGMIFQNAGRSPARMACYTMLPAGLVLCPGNVQGQAVRATGGTGANRSTYEQASTNGSPGRIPERKTDMEGALACKKLTFRDNNQSVRISAGAIPGQYTNGGNVAIMATRKEATSAVNPLESNTALVCAGRGAIALGIATSIDHAGAPSSHGDAENATLTWSGVNPVEGKSYTVPQAGDEQIPLEYPQSACDPTCTTHRPHRQGSLAAGQAGAKRLSQRNKPDHPPRWYLPRTYNPYG